MTASAEWVDKTVAALEPLSHASNASAMQSYMKDVAPFLGVTTPDRRSALRSAWRGLTLLDPAGVSDVVRDLWALPEREYQYAACDLIGRHAQRLPGRFLIDPIQDLITTRSWWDTVDSLGSVAVTPLVAQNPEQVGLMWEWLDSGDMWLIRAAIQHQRGRRDATDFALLYAMCDPFAGEPVFWIAKAVGWALRDATRWDPAGVQSFVDAHPDLSAVARREALRGLDRSSRP